MKFKVIHFIVNPISGKGTGEKVKKRIEEIFSEHDIQIKLTGKKDDAYEFALKSVEEGAELIVSCGGDGTLSEVASALVGKEVPLAIVPIGSGNGLARHLQIPLQPEEALQLVLKSERVVEKIDCGKINDSYFFSNAGIGFDAEAVKVYAHQKQRQLLGYIKCIFLSVFKFRPVQVSLSSEEMNFNGKVMMLNISNSNCLGYGFSVAPRASLQDGKFDINLVSKCSWVVFLFWIGAGFLFNQNWGKKRKLFHTQKLNIITSADYMQMDGEYHILESKTVEISILPHSLSVLVG